MARHTHLNPDRVINGSFGELYDENGTWMAEAQDIKFKVANETKKWKGIGSRRTADKLIGTSGTGTIKQFHVNSELLSKVARSMGQQIADMFVGNLVITLDDPEQSSIETVTLYDVKFLDWEGGFTTNDLVMENITFSFFSMDIGIFMSRETSVGDPAIMDDWAQRYAVQRNM
jgi:hypothetical protein